MNSNTLHECSVCLINVLCVLAEAHVRCVKWFVFPTRSPGVECVIALTRGGSFVLGDELGKAVNQRTRAMLCLVIRSRMMRSQLLCESPSGARPPQNEKMHRNREKPERGLLATAGGPSVPYSSLAVIHVLLYWHLRLRASTV